MFSGAFIIISMNNRNQSILYDDISLPDWSQVHILVVGDVMLDRYWHGAVHRISPEAPVPVARIEEMEHRPGGAANVALNLAQLGAKVTLAGVIGNDLEGQLLQQALDEQGIECLFLADERIPTITKLRVMSRHQQLLRMDFEASNADVAHVSIDLVPLLIPALKRVSAVILSDYAKGTLHHVHQLIAQCRHYQVPVLADPKGRDFERYRHATVLKPNQREFEEALGPWSEETNMQGRMIAMCRHLDLEALLVTRGEQGMRLAVLPDSITDIPAHPREVYDVTGAGDTVIAVLTAGIACGLDITSAAKTANIAAGMVVGKMGTSSVSAQELAAQLSSEAPSKILDETALVQKIKHIRTRNETLVMTNGCFDILHPGHIQLLQKAREFGDHLLVAVNDDASIRRLKGSQRPINPLSHRMFMLAALEYVDWLVPFTEDTPGRLIDLVSPDILVKGGDYTISQIVGADTVINAGGKVHIIPMIPGHSTTALINRVSRQE